jgi:hypothetical protein
MSSDQQVYTPAFTSGVRIPTDMLLRTELAIIAAFPFRLEQELIYNSPRFAQRGEPGSWSLAGSQSRSYTSFFLWPKLIDRDAAASSAARFAISSIV